jgi:hypothetical protein
MSLLLLLAEGSDLDKANQAIDTFDKLGKAGPVTLSLVIAFGAIIFAVYMMKKNWKLREDHANELKDREKNAKEEHKSTLADVLKAAEERRNAEKDLYKQMIESGIEATQALEGSNKALESFKIGLENFQNRLESLDRDQEKRFNELLRAINNARGTA